MITLLIGENSFEVEQRLQRLIAEFDGVLEKFDGMELEVKQLPDLLMGLNLFAERRLVIVRGLGANKQTWDALPDWLDRMSDDIHLVLVEPKPDKRTKSWKVLQKAATVHEYKLWGERDTRVAEKWVVDQANGTLSAGAAHLLVARVGIDQWLLAQAVEKLSVYDNITEDLIRETVEAQPYENVFELFEAALRSDTRRVQEMITTLSQGEDPYPLFGLLLGQAFQLAVLATARDGDEVAKDIGVHPFVLSKLQPHATRLGIKGTGKIIAAFAAADEAMKTSSIDPWLAIERALLRVSV